MSTTRKYRCWSCQSLDVIKWGTRNGKQRFKCKDCGALSTRKNQEVSKANRFVRFREWITGKQTFAQLSLKSGYSKRSSKHYFYHYLNNYPVCKITSSEEIILFIDPIACLLLYCDNNVKSTFITQFF